MIKLLSHLSHIEVNATNLEESVAYYEKQLGLRVIERDGNSVYLRSWGDYYTYSVVLTQGEEAGMVSMAWRTSSDEALDEAASRIEAAGHAGEWRPAGAHLGRSYVFTGPYGHTMQLFWEVDKFKAEGTFASTYPDRPERRSRDGVAPRQLDHVTVAASDVVGFANWYSEVLGFRQMAFAGTPDGSLTFFGVLTTNEKSHDLGILLDGSDRAGRIHHYAFWVDTPEDLYRAANILIEGGTAIEYGPGIHGIGEQNFLYFREPSGLRVEINSGGYRNYIPDWQPNLWTTEQGCDDFFINRTVPQSMLEASPPADGPTATEQGIVPGSEDALIAAGMLHPNV
jgi:catechol 2,3-dioxygenase